MDILIISGSYGRITTDDRQRQGYGISSPQVSWKLSFEWKYVIVNNLDSPKWVFYSYQNWGFPTALLGNFLFQILNVKIPRSSDLQVPWFIDKMRKFWYIFTLA